jgi:hypothetical protein
MKKTYFLAVWAALTAVQAWAFYEMSSADFGPFKDDEKTTQVAVKTLDQLESSQADAMQTQKLGIKEDPQAPAWKVAEDTQDPKNHSTLFQLLRNPKKKPLQFEVRGKDLVDFFTADLNGDGVPDYILTFRGESQGAGEEEEEGQDQMTPNKDSFIVLLSSKKTYRAFLVEKAHLPEWGIYQLGPQAQTALLATGDFKDPKTDLPPDTRVIFHLYQLLSVKGSELVLDNSLDSRFPKFVAQDEGATHKNHKETKLLTDSRKKELLSLYQPAITEMHFMK